MYLNWKMWIWIEAEFSINLLFKDIWNIWSGADVRLIPIRVDSWLNQFQIEEVELFRNGWPWLGRRRSQAASFNPKCRKNRARCPRMPQHTAGGGSGALWDGRGICVRGRERRRFITSVSRRTSGEPSVERRLRRRSGRSPPTPHHDEQDSSSSSVRPLLLLFLLLLPPSTSLLPPPSSSCVM